MENAEHVVTNMVMINYFLSCILFDCRACHSFISKKFARVLNVKPCILDDPYRVTTLGGKVLVSNLIIRAILYIWVKEILRLI